MPELNMVNAMLNTSWDQIDDLPSYVNLPTGSYQVRVTKAEVKEPKADDVDGEASIRVHMEVVSTLETKDGVDHPAAGSLCMFSFKGAKGVQRLKGTFGAIAQTIGANNPVELLDRMENLELGITVQQSPNSQNPDRPYTNLLTAVMA